jgi:hypothetical protein
MPQPSRARGRAPTERSRAPRTCRVADDGAEHARDVARRKADGELLRLAALLARLGHDVLVQRLHDVLKRGKLHHRVRDLAAPQRHERLEQRARALGADELGHAVCEALGKAGARLHRHLDCLEGRERDVGEELGRRRARQEDDGLVLGDQLLARHVRVRPAAWRGGCVRAGAGGWAHGRHAQAVAVPGATMHARARVATTSQPHTPSPPTPRTHSHAAAPNQLTS